VYRARLQVRQIIPSATVLKHRRSVPQRAHRSVSPAGGADRGSERVYHESHSGFSVRAYHAGPCAPQREQTAIGFDHSPIFQRLMFSRR
jgi:hypothetical protein